MPNADHPDQKAAALTLTELDQLFSPFLPLKSVLLAVSGGADSLALMVLCHTWKMARSVPVSLHSASVNHGLRREAPAECAFVAALAQRIGMSHETLAWTPAADLSNLQSQARRARYQLLSDHARSLDCRHIALAHHLDDQAETFVIRLLRGSGVPGLGAMRQEQVLDDMVLLRPFLTVPKARLRASLTEIGQDWIEDPSNQQDTYLRVRVRQLMPLLASEGGDAERLAATALRMQRADAALDTITEQAFQQHVQRKPGRSMMVPLDAFQSLEHDVRLRLWRKLFAACAGALYPPREERLLSLDEAFVRVAHKDRVKRTMGGCCFELADGKIWIYRELGRDPFCRMFKAGDPVAWPGLYKAIRVEQGDPSCPLTLRPLGQEGVRLVEALDLSLMAFRAQNGQMPLGLVHALPSIWHDGQPIFIFDWPEMAKQSGIRVEFEEKDTKSVPNEIEN